MQPFYNGKYDRVFKAIFCDESNPNMLKVFLEKLLNIEITEIYFLKQELELSDIRERKKIVDLLVKVKENYIHIELNSSNQSYLHVRNFCYFANIISRNTRKGKQYNKEIQFIHIDLSYGIKGKEARSEYQIRDEVGSLYIKNVKIIEYNMDRIMEYWYTADRKKIEEYKYLIMLGLDRETLREFVKGDTYMEAYQKKVEELNNEEIYIPWITPEEDEEFILNTEKDISFKEGKQERNIEVARNLLESGVDIQIIQKATGLTKEQIYA